MGGMLMYFCYLFHAGKIESVERVENTADPCCRIERNLPDCQGAIQSWCSSPWFSFLTRHFAISLLLLSQTDTNSQNFYWHLNSFPVCFLNFLKAQCRYRRVAIKHKHIYLNFSSETYRHRHRILYWIIVQFNCLALNVTMSHSYFISHGVTVTCCIYNIIYTPSLQISNIFNKSYNCQILNWTSDSDETFDIWYFYWEIESYRKSLHQCIMYHNIICLTQQ